MRTPMLGLITAAMAATGAYAAAPAADPAPVIAAERAFAARAGEVGVAPSFLEFMADDAIVFAPGPMLARAVYTGRPPGKPPKDGGPLLAWWPNFAGISRSGDLGFTTGPATLNGKPMGIFYFTVWARQPDGGWKWVYDGGAGADGAAAPGPGSPPVQLPPGDAKPIAPAVAMGQVQAAEASLAQRAVTDSAAALKAVLSTDAHVQGSKLAPAVTPAAVDKELATRARKITFHAIGGGAAKAGDLAWTYGDALWESADPKEGLGHYVRIWQRRAGKWSLVFDQIL
ncbi:MAG: DUF4440 domain-containing protein [Phenylobacterium sp.]